MKVDEGIVGLALRELAEQTEPAGPPMAAIMQRGQRARRTRTAGLAGACVGLVVIVVVAASAAGLAQPRRGPHEPMTPEMRLAAALEATGQTSFRLRITTQWDPPIPNVGPNVYTGAYDPAAGNGYLSGIKTDGIRAQRIVGGVLYLQQDEKTWWQPDHCGPGFYFDNLKTGDGGTLSRAGVSADPKQLLDMLRQNGKVTELGRQGSGAKAVDRYQFTAAVEAGLPGSSTCTSGAGSISVTINITGMAEVGVRSGMVGFLTYREPEILPVNTSTSGQQYSYKWQPSPTNGVRITVEMTDYGLPVVVKAPGP